MSEQILWLLIGTGLCLLVAWQWQRRRAAEAQRAAEKQAEERQAEQRRLADEQAARQAALQAEREAEARAEAQRQAERRDAEARQAAERAEADRLEAERLEVERLEAARQRAAAEQAAREAAARAEAQRQAEWCAEQERLAAARAKAERIEAERIEASRLEAERLAAEHAAAERLEAERVAAERAAAAAAAAPRVAKTAAQTLVLVADDSKVVRIKTGRLLAQHQYRVAYASDGLDAVQQLQAQQPDLLITDVEMPGMDGFELTRHIRGNPQTAKLPVIMITAADDRHREQADAAGVSVLLGKPYAEDALVAHLRLALGQDGTAAAAVADSRHGVLDALA